MPNLKQDADQFFDKIRSILLNGEFDREDAVNSLIAWKYDNQYARRSERMNQLIGKLEVATTDGDLSSLTQDDIGEIYSWMLAQKNKGDENA